MRGHSRHKARHLLVKFHAHASAHEIRAAIGRVGRLCTTACADDARFLSLAISALGYRQMGIALRAPGVPSLTRERLRLSSNQLTAPEWQGLSAFVTVAAPLLNAAADVQELLGPAADCAIQDTHVLMNANGQATEHFGFVDAISQPQFFLDPDRPASRDNANPPLVLVPDLAMDDPHDAGSFLVVLKIEQKVAAFRREIQRLAEAWNVSPSRAEAMMMGRWRDGTPLVLQDEPGNPTNEFDYASDPDGKRCPFSAHARKMSPRLGAQMLSESATRIVRRGMPYGDPAPAGIEHDHGRGLLFQCLQRHIPDQFERLFNEWANNPNFPCYGAGVDPIFQFTEILGGEYFFLPSMAFFEQC